MNEVILKAARRGRLRHTPEQKRARVEACEASGLSFPRIAALHEVNYQTLVFQVKKSRQGDPRMESSTFSDKVMEHFIRYRSAHLQQAGSEAPLIGICPGPFISVMDLHAMTDMNEAILEAGRRGRLRHTPEQDF